MVGKKLIIKHPHLRCFIFFYLSDVIFNFHCYYGPMVSFCGLFSYIYIAFQWCWNVCTSGRHV